MTSFPDEPIQASAAPTGTFHQHFRRRVDTLQEQIESIQLTGASTSDRQAAIDEVRVGVARLSSEVADTSGNLASYDQRSYIQAIKDLQDKLAVLQASHAPKAKFSFKNKRLTAPASEANSATTSRSVTPTHLRDPENIGRGVPTPALAAPSAHVMSNLDHEHDEEGSKLAESSANDNQWILISGKENSLFQWPHEEGQDEQEASHSQYGKTCVLSEISSSIVTIGHSSKSPPPSALTLNTVKAALVVALDIGGAAHITGLRNSVLVLNCLQFRMHSSHNVDVYLYCPNRPIIEDCSNIRFTRVPTVLQTSGLGAGLDTGNAETKQNSFDQVDDFKWLRSEASPNWKVMQEEEGVKEQAWQEVLEALHRLGGEADESLTRTMVARTLQKLDIKTGG